MLSEEGRIFKGWEAGEYIVKTWLCHLLYMSAYFSSHYYFDAITNTEFQMNDLNDRFS